MPRYANTVPQGTAGTGNAVIYGDNPVAAQFGNQLAAIRQREYQQELLKQRQAEELAKMMRDNQLAASEGRLWAQDIGKLEQDHIQKGIDLQQKGLNPYGSSPQALEYMKERRQVQAQQGYRKATEAQFNELDKLISANPDKYRPEDIQAVHDYFNTTKLSDAYSKNMGLPQLRERFKANDYLKGSQAVTTETKDQKGNIISEKKTLDVPATENMLIGTLTRDPQGVEFLNKITSGVPVNEIRGLDDTVEGNEFKIRKMYNENATLRTQFARDHGVHSFSPEYDKVINDIAREQTKIKRKFNSEIAPLVAASAEGLALFDKNTPVIDRNAMTDYQKAQLELSKQRLNIQKVNTAKKGADTTSTDVRRSWIQDIRNVKGDAMERLLAAGNAKGGYNPNDKFSISQKKGAAPISAGKGVVVLHVPAKVKTEDDPYNPGAQITTVTTPARDFTLNLGDPNFETTMNTLIGDITGAYVDLGSTGAKSANLKKSPPLSKVKAAPVKTTTSKVSDSEFEELLKRAKALKGK